MVGEERKENVRRNGQPDLPDAAGGVMEERKSTEELSSLLSCYSLLLVLVSLTDISRRG